MKKSILLVLITSMFYMAIHGQDTIPHVKGRILISVRKGTIECDLTLSNMPQLSDYYLRLNSGMNIRYIKNAEPGMLPLRYERSQDDTLSSGESLAYYIPSYNESGKYLPHAVHFNYVGMYPVITDTTSAVDWRGNIAFNGKTLRADGIQSAWCPILYDVKTDRSYENVTYDLDITCHDCNVIYVNGSQPVSGTHAKVRSSTPQDLTLFSGDFKSVAINGNYFLNPDADEQQLTQLENTLDAYQKYLENKLGIPYKGKAVYIQTTPVSKNNSWMFASYPTIVSVSWHEGMKSFANKSTGTGFLQYMAHELAHYYFGKVRAFNSATRGMISEGFAEFLAMRITKNFISNSKYNDELKSKVRAMNNLTPVPMQKIRSEADYRNRELYVYYYAPLVFLAIEKEIGEEKMWTWLKVLLLSPAVKTDYTFFEQTLKEVVSDKAKFDLVREKYLESNQAFQNAVSALSIPADEFSAANNNIPVTKTYYYYVISRPMADIGSSQNNMIVHTEVAQITCLTTEFLDRVRATAIKVKQACKNATGCTNDINSYNSIEEAQAGLKRLLDRYNKNGRMVVKVLKP
ncbi:gluzincin family metallopeptidase [Flavisolibacter ginsengisoli]|jgi:hypothetical protein|nr:M1 family metallopeptidase [Flavisolibacter ginsengisoli]